MLDTAFISRRFDIHPSEVPGAAADWHRGLPPVRVGRNSVQFDHQFRLASEPEQGHPDPLQLYAVRGVLWVKARPIRVSLEFSIWSSSVTEVAMRPSGLAWPVGTKAYWDRVAAILDDIIESVAASGMCHRVIGEDAPVDEADLAPLISAA